jgi:hypothetical protein
MTPITTLQRRLEVLELPPVIPDYELMALEALSDLDLDLLQEANALYRSGHSDAEIAALMGDRWPLYQKAAAHFKKEYNRLTGEDNKA